MRAADSSAIPAAEVKSLFSDLEHLPALVLAVSGGPDSTALMLLAARWRDTLRTPPKLIAVTVDHGLRKEARREAAAVGTLARQLKVAHRTVRWTGRKPKTGLQQAAREARYRLLAQAARKARASHILTAHTLDDQAETVLIRMSRGSGIAGLAAMMRTTPLARSLSTPSPLEGEGWGGGYETNSNAAKLPPSRRASRVDLPLKGGGEEKKDANKIFLVRPLLDIPKTRLIATLKAANIPAADDPSNRDPRFTRARLRGLMPRLAEEGLDAPRLALLARRLKRADRAIEAAVGQAMGLLQPSPEGKGVRVDADAFAKLPAEIALRAIGRAIAQEGDEGPVELGKLEALMDALNAAQKNGKGFRRSLAGAVVTLAKGQITVERAPPRRQRALTNPGQGKAGRTKRR